MSRAEHAPLRLNYSALSDMGPVRKDNQDSGYAGPHLLAVADGVGGSARGDVASAAAIERLRSLDIPPGNDPLAELSGAITAAHTRIAGLVRRHPELEGTSTTVSALLFDGTRVGLAHVGDSRAYLLREGELSQLTKDHTFVQGLVDEGRITDEESRVHPHRNLILKAVDGVREPDPDLTLLEVRLGDRLMVCSDGACGVLDNTRLAEILSEGTPDFAAVELVSASLAAGTTDNVTVVVADVVEDTEESSDTTQAMSLGPLIVGAAAEAPRLAALDDTATGKIPVIPSDGSSDESADVDPEEVRYAPRPPSRFRWVRRALALAIIGVLAWAGGAAAYAWTQKQYYVGVAGDYVAIYRGVQASLPLIKLHTVAETSNILVTDLPDFRQKAVRAGMDASGLDDARATVERLDKAAQCETASSIPTPTASPTPRKGTKSPSPTPSATPDPCLESP